MKTTNTYNTAFWNMMRGASTKVLAEIAEGEKPDGIGRKIRLFFVQYFLLI